MEVIIQYVQDLIGRFVDWLKGEDAFELARQAMLISIKLAQESL